MPTHKYIALFFASLFCIQMAIAHQATGKLFFGEDFRLVKTYCPNKMPKDPASDDRDEMPDFPLMTCSLVVLDFIPNQTLEVEGTVVEDRHREGFMYKDNFLISIDLENPLPPPKFS